MSNEQIPDAVKRQLEDHEKRILGLEKILGEGKKEEPHEIARPKNGIKRLAAKISISEEDIKKIFDLEENSLTLVKVIGEDDKERTKSLTLLVLLGYQYLFGVGEVLSHEIKRNAAENRIPVNNFATYLNEITPSLIRRKGKPGSTKTAYRLTTSGEVEARELLKNLAGNQ